MTRTVQPSHNLAGRHRAGDVFTGHCTSGAFWMVLARGKTVMAEPDFPVAIFRLCSAAREVRGIHFQHRQPCLARSSFTYCRISDSILSKAGYGKKKGDRRTTTTIHSVCRSGTSYLWDSANIQSIFELPGTRLFNIAVTSIHIIFAPHKTGTMKVFKFGGPVWIPFHAYNLLVFFNIWIRHYWSLFLQWGTTNALEKVTEAFFRAIKKSPWSVLRY
jgi:hypothetical protein